MNGEMSIIIECRDINANVFIAMRLKSVYKFTEGYEINLY